MHRLAHVLLVVVALFVTVVVATLVAKSRTASVESAQPRAAADLHIKEADIEEQSGTVRWRLKAEQALVFETEGRTALRKISVVVHDKDRSWTIVGDEGDVREPRPRMRNVEVRKNVVLTSNDGLRLETTVLRWESAAKRLWTDAPVRLIRESAVVDGTAFELHMGDETATVHGRVHAKFSTADRR